MYDVLAMLAAALGVKGQGQARVLVVAQPVTATIVVEVPAFKVNVPVARKDSGPIKVFGSILLLI